MKVSDLLNVLAHIPGEIEVDAEHLLLKFEHGAVSAGKALENIVTGQHVATGAESPPA